jgi:N-acetylmuramoyl-L-alanine amidase CwlA
MIRVTDRIVYPSRATFADALDALDAARIDYANGTVEFLRALDYYASRKRIDFAVIASHAANECDLFRDARFRDRRDAFGIGVTAAGVPGASFKTYDDAAFYAVTEYCLKLRIELTEEEVKRARFINSTKFERVVDLRMRPDFPRVERIEQMNAPFGDDDCWWMCDPNGPAAIVEKSHVLFPNVPDQDTVGAADVPTYATTIPGLPGGPLVTTHPVHIRLVPEWRKNNRPGIPARSPRRSVQHGNGNPNSSAAQEANYLFNGAEGRQASYHSTTDDRESWIMVPANEVTWQAADGDGPGNMNGFSNEMVEDAALWADPVRRDRAIANAAELMGAVAARLNIDIPEQHWTFNAADPNRHDCPNKLRHVSINGRLAWHVYADLWHAAKAAEHERMDGKTEPTPIPTPTKYARPVTNWMKGNDKTITAQIAGKYEPIKVWAVEREYEAIARTWRRQWPDTSGPKVGDRLEVRERFKGAYVAKVGNSWWCITPAGSWLLMSALTPRVSIQAA